MKTIGYYLKVLMEKNGEFDQESFLELDNELKLLEKQLSKFNHTSKIVDRGVEPIEKELKYTQKELMNFKSKVFDCFIFDKGDEDNFTIDTDKLSKLREDAWEWKYL